MSKKSRYSDKVEKETVSAEMPDEAASETGAPPSVEETSTATEVRHQTSVAEDESKTEEVPGKYRKFQKGNEK